MFDVDDIVFARLEGYPFWPARVITPESNHLSHLGMTKIPPNHRLVLFYNDGGQFAAMQTSDLRNFADRRIQKKTSLYDGPHKSQLLVAFQAALKEHSLTQPRSNSHSPPINSPARKPRPEKHRSSDLTSPVTGHSDTRQPITPKTNKPSKKPTPRSASPPDIPLQPSHHKPSPSHHTMASRTHPDTSPSTHLPQPQQRPARSNPSSRKPSSRTTTNFPDPSHSQPSPSIRLRLRLKRTSPPTSPSSPLTLQPPVKPVTKGRHLVNTETEDDPPHPRTQRAERTTPYHRPSHQKPRPSIEKHDTVEPHQRSHTDAPEMETRKSNRRARTSMDHDRIPRLTDTKRSYRTDGPRQGSSENAPAPSKSRHQRMDSKHPVSEKTAAQDGSIHETDKLRRIRKRKRSSKDSSSQLDDSDIDGGPRTKEMRSASKHSPCAERELQSQQEQYTDIGARDMDDDAAAKVVEKGRSQKSEKNRKSTKVLKTDMVIEDRSTAFDHLTKSECIELILHLQDTVRCNNVELWRRGINLAGKEDVVKTEDGLKEACNGALRKVEQVLELMKGGKGEKSRVGAQEMEAYNACMALRDVYFDLDDVKLNSLGKRMVDVVKTVRTHSIKVSRALMDVVVLWADLTTEDAKQQGENQENVKQETENQEMKIEEEIDKKEKTMKETVKEGTVKGGTVKEETVKEERRKEVVVKRESRHEEDDNTETEKGSGQKKSSARERRLDRFDRQRCSEAMTAVLGGDEEQLKIDEKEKSVMAKRLEREIRPRFEEDRLGYYKASVNVIRGLRKALRQGVAKEEEDEEKGKKSSALKLLRDAIKYSNREKTKQLVRQLNGR